LSVSTLKQKNKEKELVIRLQNKDKAAFGELYDNYSAALLGIIFKVTKHREIAEDALQDAFVKIWKNFDSYNPEKATLFTWMLNVCRNVAIDKIRSKTYRTEIQDIEDSVDIVDSSNNVELNQDTMDIKTLTNKLSSPQKEVIEAVYFTGFTHEEASESLNIPLGTLKTRFRAAIKELRKNFE